MAVTRRPWAAAPAAGIALAVAIVLGAGGLGWQLLSGPGVADGVLAAAVTPFDASPAVGNLRADLLVAVRTAAREARRQQVDLVINSGWRSSAYQGQLLDAAVAKYGSATQAARWVASAETSAHVHGKAVDIGPTSAASWLARNGARFGLCRVYRNEPWHFELRPAAAKKGCPRLREDARADARMRQ